MFQRTLYFLFIIIVALQAGFKLPLFRRVCFLSSGRIFFNFLEILNIKIVNDGHDPMKKVLKYMKAIEIALEAD